jgi:hypothetical protein
MALWGRNNIYVKGYTTQRINFLRSGHEVGIFKTVGANYIKLN